MTREELSALILQIAPQIDLHLNPTKYQDGERKVGFLLCAFDFGEKGSLAYCTTAGKPGQLADALIELMENLGASAEVHVPGRRGKT